mmetsp:Transcript_28154/g.82745  ORF Transcript_28154/g.82745 Transcript_28154/m.82745 type:complete len:287 (-) Transcript_28154:497-1357(-)
MPCCSIDGLGRVAPRVECVRATESLIVQGRSRDGVDECGALGHHVRAHASVPLAGARDHGDSGVEPQGLEEDAAYERQLAQVIQGKSLIGRAQRGHLIASRALCARVQGEKVERPGEGVRRRLMARDHERDNLVTRLLKRQTRAREGFEKALDLVWRTLSWLRLSVGLVHVTRLGRVHVPCREHLALAFRHPRARERPQDLDDGHRRGDHGDLAGEEVPTELHEWRHYYLMDRPEFDAKADLADDAEGRSGEKLVHLHVPFTPVQRVAQVLGMLDDGGQVGAHCLR